MNNRKKAYGRNRGGAAFIVIFFTILLILVLGVLLYDRIEKGRDEGEMAARASTDTHPDTELILPEKIEPGAYKNAAKRINRLTSADDAAKGQVVEAGGDEQGQPEKPDESQYGVHSGLFYYDKLQEGEKEVYCQIYHAMVTREDAVLSTLDVDLADRLYQFIIWDHPEIFDTNGYQIVKRSIANTVTSLTMKPKFDMTVEEKNNCQALIDNYVGEFMAGAPTAADSYTKIKYVYEYLIRNTEYELGCENSQNICSVFILRRSVCAGYAKATQYLLQKLSVPATIVHGTVDGQSHAWNLVFVDQVPYYLDTTWGDASYSFADGQTEDVRQPDINYDYFLITEKEITATHKIENKEYYPAAVATNCNYYRKEGLYFEFYDKKLLQEKIDEAYQNGASNLTIRLSSSALLAEMQRDLIDNQNIFHYVKNVDRFYFNINENMQTMTFWLY